MPVFPERFKVSHEAVLAGAEDDWGNPVEGFADPVEVKVYGWGPPAPDDPLRDLGTGLDHDIDLYCATSFCGHLDRVTLPNEPLALTVQGNPDDFNHGPFGFMPGYRVKLKRVEG